MYCIITKTNRHLQVCIKALSFNMAFEISHGKGEKFVKIMCYKIDFSKNFKSKWLKCNHLIILNKGFERKFINTKNPLDFFLH